MHAVVKQANNLDVAAQPSSAHVSAVPLVTRATKPDPNKVHGDACMHTKPAGAHTALSTVTCVA